MMNTQRMWASFEELSFVNISFRGLLEYIFYCLLLKLTKNISPIFSLYSPVVASVYKYSQDLEESIASLFS